MNWNKFYKLLDTLKLNVCFGNETVYLPAKTKTRKRAVIYLTVGLRSFAKNPYRLQERIVRDVFHEIGHLLVVPPQRKSF